MNWLILLLATLMTQPVGGPSPPDWTQMLRGFDLIRSQAFEQDEPAALDAVYPASSPLLRADRRTLADYRERGLRFVRMRMRIESAHVLRASTQMVRLDVVDRLATVSVRTREGTVRQLPRDLPTRRTIEISFTPAGWRITAVVPQSP